MSFCVLKKINKCGWPVRTFGSIYKEGYVAACSSYLNIPHIRCVNLDIIDIPIQSEIHLPNNYKKAFSFLH